ncbi:ribonuclease H-like protein [Cystobasidium minutum MCA 4210]|uniref:ribonuclease H-like protein n=1 Tax=Cystobasidium minutum MCA 4210 TaxID=1397322 RepID=UPI0034CF11CD|eukprot:jgi/Rhomi1/196306/gm1.4520_g
MVYIMEMWCDGGCSNNGRSNPNLPVLGGAGVYFPRALDTTLQRQSFLLPSIELDQGDATATNNRAELYAISLALKTVYKAKETLRSNPRVQVTLYTDSKYAAKAISVWSNTWMNNGWISKWSGLPVANQDLLREIIELEMGLIKLGDTIAYVAIDRHENWEAHNLATRGVTAAIRLYECKGMLEYE